MFRSLLLLAATSLSACSWVALEPPAENVMVLPEERLTSDCKSLGQVKVSVLDKVGVLERHDSEVIDDLDVLARNQAARQNGDTVVARGPVVKGVREYEIFRCLPKGAVRKAAPASPATPQEKSSVEVLPYDGGSDSN